MKRVTLAYFSPTRTTRAVLEAIARGMGAETIDHIDLTPREAASVALPALDAAPVLLGAPVYAGRLPAVAARRLRRLQGRGTPAVVVVVYGNRAFDDALLELSDLAEERGFVPVAAGAFIGEHSYATEATPIAVGRPDARDVAKARAFGRAIANKLAAVDGVGDLGPLHVPGHRPYRQGGEPSEIAPVVDMGLCILCGRCAEACPVAAIVVDEDVAIDGAACILCCACVKVCPTGACVMENGRVRGLAQWLAREHAERKEPETFLS